MNREELIESLASIEHDQWIHWAQGILNEEDISEERAARWLEYFKPYEELDDSTKEFDRIMALKVVTFLESSGVVNGI